MTDLFADQKDDLDEKWHDTFDELTAQGKAPTSIKATIEYVTTGRTQKEVASEYNVSVVTIRTLQTAVVALGPVDSRTESLHHSHSRTAIDYCSYIADHLGWDEGVEYGVTDPSYANSKQPRMRKEGWKALYYHLKENTDE